MEVSSLEFIPTRASSGKEAHARNFKVHAFESYKPKKTRNSVKEHSVSNAKKEDDFFNIRRAKHEIIRFGISGFDPQKKEEAKIQLAIKLGAKPPKNKYKNYKLLKEEKKKENERELARLHFQQLGKTDKGKSTAKGKSYDRKRRKKKGDILGVYGKVKAAPE